ncbi:Loader and inhibitor of phage G40P [Thermanaeromonas toyohensis ToBE]|uniref:Loader and inhibitor of phage G40P n=1 Tax=Thermanaeromonas toyohensis ToBE TaxID=698762 RepID=A0A1W1VY94_9FIRM|nr:replicative helicase loader/inhibitor [Thermanaeromonas toyohensis]SMB97824.1 Loader and inhibitor of phage G40P [Thermanaeromonas toyohensis ToBE]
MTEQEAAYLVALAAANFPALQEKDLGPTVELWYRLLQDLPYQVVEKALLKVLSEVRYFPTVAEIRQAAAEIMQPETLSPGEAWALVLQAVKRYGSYREAEALAALPEDVARAVRYLGWREICLSEQPEVVRAQFMKVYEQVIGRQRESVVTPREVRELTAKIAQQKALGGGKVVALPKAGEK